MKNNTIQKVLGFVLLPVILILGGTKLASSMLFFRLLIGLGLGYALSRGYIGFAGSVNRAYNTGSTKLMRVLMVMFVSTAAIVGGMLLFSEPAADFGLWINPINIGLILGALLFGYGMTFSSCCASGVLTDLVTETPKAFVTLIFFGLGVFLGFPLQSSQDWIQKSWFRSSDKFEGVFLPDWFSGGPLNGYLGAFLVTLLFAAIVYAVAWHYEKKRHDAGTHGAVPSEARQENEEKFDLKNFKLFSAETYYQVFSKPWSMLTGAVMITILFAVLMGATGSGWGASTPYGQWFGRLVAAFGVPADRLADFTGQKPEVFTTPFFEMGMNLQNIGIILGTLIYFLTSGQFAETFRGAWKLKWWQFLLFAMGGLTMGFGTRLSNGCNVGALYSPIANFSLSGWIWLVFMVIGGIIGNKLQKAIYDKMS